MKLSKSHLTRILLGAAGLALVSTACNTHEAKLATQPIVGPVEPEFAPIVTITSDRSRLATDNERGANLEVRAVDARTGASVPNLTIASLETNIGAFGGQSGPKEIELEFFFGVARTVFFPGSEIGTATVRAEVEGGVAITTIRVVCPSDGCGGGGPTFPDDGEL